MHDDLFGTTPPAPAKKTPKLYPIPADNYRLARCSGCDASVYWVKGTRFPISTDCEGGRRPWPETGDSNASHDGVGVSHFTNCPNVDQFSGRNRGR